MSNLKLAVEVVRAHNLMSKQGQGSSNVFVELHFDGQKFRTTVKEKDLEPMWNESFHFNVTNPNDLHKLTLEAYVFNNNKATGSKASLGKVRITGTSFVPFSDADVFDYPLERGGIFSRVRGELGLKVYITNDAILKSSVPPHEMASSSYSSMHSVQEEHPSRRVEDVVPGSLLKGKKRSTRTFHHLPNSSSQLKPISEQSIKLGNSGMKLEPQLKPVELPQLGFPSQPIDFTPRETSPLLGGGQVVGGKVRRPEKQASVYDLVEPMEFLFVRVVKAQGLPPRDLTGSLDPFVEVKLGNYKGVTKHFEKNQNPEWNTVFTFSKDRMQSSTLEIVVKDKNFIKDEPVGYVQFGIHEIPTRFPPDSPLAPEWYLLRYKNSDKRKGELMLAVWIGTQADEAFPDAWHSDAASPVDIPGASSHMRAKVYHSPRMWYLRVNVIEVQDLVMTERNRFPVVHVKLQIGNQVLKTKSVQSQTMNALWNEDLMFVAAEPFDDVILSVEDNVSTNKDELLGRVTISSSCIERRIDDRPIHSRWFNLERPGLIDIDEPMKDRFSSRVHLRMSFDGGYHVLDESIDYISDLRPTAKELWKTPIGVLELGILNADALTPMKTRDGRGTSDSYCVAKYGQKWVRTRTIMDCLNPKYNEQYSWEVFDSATVITIGVFDNHQISDKDSNSNQDGKIGKVRIRISTLETERIYTHSYPLLVIQPNGVKKMGDLHLAIRFTCMSMTNMMHLYSKPLLPKMHYVRPITMHQLHTLRQQAISIVVARLSRAEPPLRREVIDYITESRTHFWSMRRSKANFLRLVSVFNGIFSFGRWFKEVCTWRNPITTVLVQVLYVMLVCFPELFLPTVFLYMFLRGLWNYRYRPRYPPHMNAKLSCSDAVHPDELDEEFDLPPASRSSDLVRMRYDRLRSVAGRIQTIVGDIASQGERVHALLSWRDPRATVIFMVFCLLTAMVFYAIPFQLLIVLAGFYVMRHPKFHHKVPPTPLNFFRRLPARTDSMF